LSEIHLFGIPYAGGSAAAIYGRWGRHLQGLFNVVPLELAGHGRRMGEPFHDSMAEVVDDLFQTVSPLARQHPYCLYGHSMGCVVAYELVRKLASTGHPPPLTVFLSGRNPPHYSYAKNPLHLMADEIFLREIRKLGGTPDEFFEMKSLIDAFLPIIRNDYRIIERYAFTPPAHVMETDLVFLHSDADPLVGEPAIQEWRGYCTGRFQVGQFKGGHFFINDQGGPICELIARTMAAARW